ncbi:MAG TPA: type IX secretion system sortase PorU, partial [Flavisolibacter sp.]
GTWYKISVPATGVYKIDPAFITSLGINGSVPSAQIRLFSGANGLLPERAGETRIDDLEEVAIAVSDGGDGQLNGSDYVLFYAEGPHKWQKDSAARRFTHRKNLYSEKAYFFITIGGNGKRISVQANPPAAVVSTTTFDERFFHEQDSVNFLSSGKQWWGEELSALSGRSLRRDFPLPLSDLAPGPATLDVNVAARSVGAGSSFAVSLNNSLVAQVPVSSITPGPYSLFAQQATQSAGVPLATANATISVTFSPGSVNSQGWINWFRFFCRRNLVLPTGQQLLFRDWQTVGNAATAFNLTVPDATAQVWDVTDAFQPVTMATTLTGNALRFSNEALRLREYVAFGTSFPTPRAEGRVAAQNLHATTEADYLIVTPPVFLPQAQRLAQFHEGRNLRTVVVTTEQVFHEFSGGIPDPAAIRDFAKLYFDRYRATWASGGKYLLLFGKGSFDYKDRIKNNTSLVPVYESEASLDPLATYTSDDFFGFLDDAEDIRSTALVNTLDIGIGRIPAKTAAEATAFVDKVLAYHSPAAFGPWRNNLDFVADDEDQNLHLQDAEAVAATVIATAPVFNSRKIYLDAFQQESGGAGGRYPGANAAINSNIYNGTLMWNYTGHGGPQRLAEEVVLDQTIVANWKNEYRLPLLITATCDFATYDN